MNESEVVDDLIDLTFALAGERKIESMLQSVIEAALRHSMAEGVAIYSLDTLGRHLHCVSAKFHGVSETSGAGENVSIYAESMAPNLKEPAAFAVSTGTVIDIADIDSMDGYDFSRIRCEDRVLGVRTRSLIVIPLTVQANRSIGVLQFTNPVSPNGASRSAVESYLRPLKSFAAQAAMALWKSRLVEENLRLNERYGDHLKKTSPRRTSMPTMKPSHIPRQVTLVGESPPIERAVELVRCAACSAVPILLRGETGTGKELMAGLIHKSSDRADKSFVAQNCAALPETLLESELFGYMKGAFTGATAHKPGLVHEAHGGTLFLDEIGNMPLTLQAKVLRLLQEGEVRRVGSTKTEAVDVRIVGATNVNLEQKIDTGEFRKDLFYRLSVFPITLPPLRERPSDIPKLIDHLLTVAATRARKAVPEVSPEALDRLMCWSYPGNVRELKNILERAILVADAGQPIGSEHLPAELSGHDRQSTPDMPEEFPEGDLKTIVGRYEALIIEAKMRETNWNKSLTARCLNVSRRTIIDKINRYEIRRPKHFSRYSSEPLQTHKGN